MRTKAALTEREISRCYQPGRRAETIRPQACPGTLRACFIRRRKRLIPAHADKWTGEYDPVSHLLPAEAPGYSAGGSACSLPFRASLRWIPKPSTILRGGIS